ncbi:GTP:AMP phosphotransferase AK3, mitochondrial-like isoform X2 [Eriocheir sinensis]|uniref:GTP:AMP phosphotransferase AK3, mitochondrial-like isoform X2 n=1 Tax=Eriocheir sinensis TaxID=95602 RepID=UPI0021CA88A3|nr:GTP:AMP phosphotransferase AK3, mitochondrial-like isoform X2 [Eriocheir sinensis]
MSKLFKMVILGAPGSGKGTISSRILRDFGLKHLSSGDVLRSQVLKKTDLGQAAEKYMKSGKLVPDEMMVKLITSELAGIKTSSWLLDGFPRTRAQAEALNQHEKGKDDVTGEPLVQREDDKLESVKKRLELYAANTGPLKAFYLELGILQSFHGTESNEIWPRVHKYLQTYLPALAGPF